MGPVLPRIACVVLFLAMLSGSSLAEAGVSAFWQELDGSASGLGVSQTVSPKAVFDGSVAVDSNGRPVVVYTEFADAMATTGPIIVKQWDGNAWQTLGGAGGIGTGYDPQVQVAANGTIYVAWLTEDGDGNTEVHLRAWNGSAFNALGNSDSIGGLSGTNPGITPPYSLAVNTTGPLANNPIVAFLGFVENGIVDVTPTPTIVDTTVQVYVRQWDGVAWSFVGSDFTGGGASNAKSFTSGANVILHDVDAPSLTVDSTGAPVVAFTYFTMINNSPAANTDIYVTRWNGSAWTAVGPAVPPNATGAGSGAAGGVSATVGGSFNPALAAGPSGKLALAWEEEPATGGVYVWVKQWNGTSWLALGTSASGSGFTQLNTTNVLPRVAYDADGRPLVAWQALLDFNEPAQIFVRRFNGTSTWDEMGFHSAREGGISDATNDALAPALASTPAGGSITAAWLDVQSSGSGQMFVRQFFSGPSFLLTTRVTGSGTVTSDPLGLDCSTGTCSAPFPDGADVSLVPQPAAGSTFVGWTGACTGSGPCTVAMTSAQSVNASFATVHRLAVVVSTPAGAPVRGAVGTVSGPGGSCPFGGDPACTDDLPHGTAVVLQATPDAGNRFLNWSGGPCSGSTNRTCAFTLNANVSTTALFRAVTGLTVSKVGSGTITGTGINCGTDCFEEVFTGTSVTLTPTPALGSRFLGWSGDVCNGQTSGACVVTTAGQTNRSVTATFQILKQRLTVSSTGAGVTTSTPSGIDCGSGGHTSCAVDYDYGTAVTLTPAADTDSMFSVWTGCTSLNGSACTVAMTANRTVTGKFVAAHTLSVQASGNGSGKITSATPPGLTCVNNCSTVQRFPATASVVLTPQPAVGTTFRWTGGDVCSGSAACTVPMSANHSAIGTFTLTRLSLTVTNRPSGNVVNQGTLPGASIDCGNGDVLCSGIYDYGTAVTLRATPNSGFTFVNWAGGACTGSANATCAFVLKANTSVTPNFRARTQVTVVKAGNGAGTVTGPGISCGADCTEPEFDAKPVTLRATPAVGSRFVGFSGDCTSSTTSCTFTPTGDTDSVTATFQLIPFTVTVGNRANGTVSSSALPGSHLCGAGNGDCVATLDFGTQVVLQAAPITGSRFVNWTGTVCAGSTNATCAFKIPAANVSVSPNFKDVTTLTLSKTGQGTVVSTPAGISCGAACSSTSFDFARGILIKLTPTPAVGWSFTGFSGDCSSLPCSVNASSPTAAVDATFSIQHRRLTVTVVGDGTVSGNTVSCDSGSTPCAQDFDYGTSVPLTATPAAGFRFTGWTQDCAGVGACSPLMTANHSVTATFRPQFGLTVTKPGNSTGTITASASPVGIPPFSCGPSVTTCGSTYLGGQVVTLTRSAPATGTTFHWGGDCAFRGTNATCPLTLNANASVTADYSLQQLALTVVKNNGALGTVTGLSGGIDCGSDCSEVVNYGTPVILQATAGSSPAAEFVSWVGCTSAPSNSSCSFTMTANKTVTATFQPLVASVEVRALSASVLAVGGNRQLQAIATFTDDTTRDVTADPQTIWTSDTAAVAAVSKTGLVTGKAQGSTSVTATFKFFGDAESISVEPLMNTGSAPPIVVTCNPYGDTTPGSSHLTCLPSALNFSVLCEATGLYVSGSHDVTDQVTWITSNAAIAQSTGLVAFNSPVRQSFRIVGNGTAVLRATLGGKTSSTTGTLGQQAWVVQGAPATVTAIDVAPPSDTVSASAGSHQLTATATLSQTGACATPLERDFSTVVGWTSADESLAKVSFFGGVRGVAAGGPVVITATYPVVNGPDFVDSASITVQQ